MSNTDCPYCGARLLSQDFAERECGVCGAKLPAWLRPPAVFREGRSGARKTLPIVLLVIGLVVGLPVLSCVGFTAITTLIRNTLHAVSTADDGGIIKSTDGSFQMRIPPGWSPATDLNAEAGLQARGPTRDIALVVLAEPKSHFRKGMTYREHSEMTRNALLKKFDEGKSVRGPTDLVIDSRPAVQYEIEFLDKDTRVTALHTTIDGRDSFYQVVFTTTPSHLKRNRSILQEILNSFTESSTL